MARGKKHNPEQVVNTLWQFEVAVANGKATPQAWLWPRPLSGRNQ
jgi:putative transposase